MDVLFPLRTVFPVHHNSKYMQVELPAVIGLAYGCTRKNKVLHHVEAHCRSVFDPVHNVVELALSPTVQNELCCDDFFLVLGQGIIPDLVPELCARCTNVSCRTAKPQVEFMTEDTMVQGVRYLEVVVFPEHPVHFGHGELIRKIFSSWEVFS